MTNMGGIKMQCKSSSLQPLKLLLVLLLPVSSACNREVDVSGTYLNIDSKGGVFVPCNQPRAMWRLSDPTLAAAFRARRQSQSLLVHLVGVLRDSGSVYGPTHNSVHYLDVRKIVELRPRQATECPIAFDTLPTPLR